MTFSYSFSLSVVYSNSDKSFGYYTKNGFQWKYPSIPEDYLPVLEGRASIYQCFFQDVCQTNEGYNIFLDENFYDSLPQDIDEFFENNEYLNGMSQEELLNTKNNINLLLKAIRYLIEEAEGNWYFLYCY